MFGFFETGNSLNSPAASWSDLFVYPQAKQCNPFARTTGGQGREDHFEKTVLDNRTPPRQKKQLGARGQTKQKLICQ